jgi:hypothetical protein
MQDWKPFSMLVLGLLSGLFIGWQLNIEKTAAAMAQATCAMDKENVKIMVSNFNLLAKECEPAMQVLKLNTLDQLEQNKTVLPYVP